MYLELSRFEPNIKAYLNFIVSDKSVGYRPMLQVRTGNHTLAVEIDRYQNRNTYEECICNSCKQQDIEDLFHVIVKCKGYRYRQSRILLNYEQADDQTIEINIGVHAASRNDKN